MSHTANQKINEYYLGLIHLTNFLINLINNQHPCNVDERMVVQELVFCDRKSIQINKNG